ncbi:MAG: hypothetical protein V2A58_00920, partial [Planctomycetota bacterium]
YQDGSSEAISIPGGKRLWDWWAEVDFLPPRVTLAWKGTSSFHWPLHVWWHEWKNPDPAKVVNFIRVKPADEPASGIPVLLGVTVAQ